MKLRFLRGVCIESGRDAEINSVHDVDNGLALVFINKGYAVLVDENKAEIKTSEEIKIQKRGSKNER